MQIFFVFFKSFSSIIQIHECKINWICHGNYLVGLGRAHVASYFQNLVFTCFKSSFCFAPSQYLPQNVFGLRIGCGITVACVSTICVDTFHDWTIERQFALPPLHTAFTRHHMNYSSATVTCCINYKLFYTAITDGETDWKAGKMILATVWAWDYDNELWNENAVSINAIAQLFVLFQPSSIAFYWKSNSSG